MKAAILRRAVPPRVVHTPDGAALLRNFVRKVAGLTGDWTMGAFKDDAIAKIRAQVGDKRVLCASPAASIQRWRRFLIHEAIATRSPACSWTMA